VSVRVIFDEGHVVIVRMPIMAEPHTRDKLMRFWDFVGRFQKIPSIDKRERLHTAARPFCRDRNIRRLPGTTALRADAPSGRHAVFEHFKRENAMPRIDPAYVRMIMMVMGGAQYRAALVGPSPPDHPARD